MIPELPQDSVERAEKALLNRIYLLSRKIEQEQLKTQGFCDQDLQIICKLLGRLSSSPNQFRQHLSQAPKHLSPLMEPEHFASFLIQIERALDRSVKDSDFLISTQDQKQKQRAEHELIFILDSLRSSFNVGNVIRLADSVGAKEVHFTGYTPTENSIPVQKTSMGAEIQMKFKSFRSASESILDLKKRKFQVIALETGPTVASLFSEGLMGPVAFLVGNERFGLNQTLLHEVDEVRTIPLFGIKNSLNVGNCLSIAAFEWLRRNRLT